MDKKFAYQAVVVGAGGTGTFFLKELSRFLYKSRSSIKGVHIFDGDRVEERNLYRQCFMPEDIGRSKAAVMAEILGAAFDIPIMAYDAFLTEPGQLKQCRIFNIYNSLEMPLLIGCVDNHAARMVMEKFFEEEKNCIYFDAANEFETGEVVFSYKRDGVVFGPVRSCYFPELKGEKFQSRSEMSCEELNRAAPQHIFTNMLAGQILCSGVSNLLGGKITPGVAYFNALKYHCDFKSFREHFPGTGEKV